MDLTQLANLGEFICGVATAQLRDPEKGEMPRDVVPSTIT